MIRRFFTLPILVLLLTVCALTTCVSQAPKPAKQERIKVGKSPGSIEVADFNHGGSLTTIALGATDEFLTKEKKKAAEMIVNQNAGKQLDAQTSGGSKDPKQ